MPNGSDVKAGGAYIEIGAPTEKLQADLAKGDGLFKQYATSAMQLMKRAEQAAGDGKMARPDHIPAWHRSSKATSMPLRRP